MFIKNGVFKIKEMKVKLEVDKEAKRAIIIVSVLVAIFLYFYNRRYLYILDAEFTDGEATEVILKTGFIFPVKTTIKMQHDFTTRIKFYGYKVMVLKSDGNYKILINNKSITTIYPDVYYDETHKKPVGRVYL